MSGRTQEQLQEMWRQQEHMKKVRSSQPGDIALPSEKKPRPLGSNPFEARKAALLKILGR